MIGYNEGALHATWLASHAEVAAVVLIGCPARTGEEALLWWAGQLADDEIPRPVKLLLRLLRRSPRDQLARMCAKIRARASGTPRLFGFALPRWYRGYLLHDPRPDIAKIGIPVLALTGAKDRNVDPSDVEVIAGLANGPVEVDRFPDLTHLLRRDFGRGSIRDYHEQYRRPTDPDLVDRITTWVGDRLIT